MTNEELDAALAPLRELLEGRETFSLNVDRNFKTKNDHQMEVHLMTSIDFDNLKHKITDTAGSIAAKTATAAKNVAEKTKGAAKNVADRSSAAAKNVAGKTKDAAKKTKLNAEIAAERETLKKKYLELGKLYYDKYAGNTDPDFAEPVANIEASLERIAEKREQIDALAADTKEPEVEVEVTEDGESAGDAEVVVDEVEATVEAEAEVAVNMAEEAADEAAKAFEEAAPTVNMPQQ